MNLSEGCWPVDQWQRNGPFLVWVSKAVAPVVGAATPKIALLETTGNRRSFKLLAGLDETCQAPHFMCTPQKTRPVCPHFPPVAPHTWLPENCRKSNGFTRAGRQLGERSPSPFSGKAHPTSTTMQQLTRFDKCLP